MRKPVLVLLLLNVFFLSNALPPSGSEEYKTFSTWDEMKRLKWSDFQGEPIQNAEEAAMTASSVEFYYKTKGPAIEWIVSAKFFPKLSWSKEESRSKYILQHEQLHFDITELYARLFRKQLADNVKTTRDMGKLKTISKEILHNWQKEEDAYDRETKHSMDEEKQDEWNANVKARLDALKDYASVF